MRYNEEAERSNTRSRRKKNTGNLIVKLVMTIILIILIVITFGRPLIDRYFPSSELKDANEWFEVSGNEVKIFLDNEPEHESKALAYGGEIYLPYDYVLSGLNSRFYYNYNEEMLTYTLADSYEDYDSSTDFGGSPAVVIDNGTPYICINLVEKFTDISHEAFASAEESAKRVFIYKGGTEFKAASVKHKVKVRTAADKKAPILTTAAKGDTVQVTDELNTYSRVVTEDGFVGYIQNDRLSYMENGISFPHTYEDAAPEQLALDKKVVMGWQYMSNADANSRLDSLYERTGGALNVICPTWLQISGANGELTDFSSAEYVRNAHEKGLEVWASVDNVHQRAGIEEFSSRDFFGDTGKRRGFIATLMEKAEAYGYDGISLDFEGLPSDAGANYSQFFRELSVECHKRGLKLSIANYVPYSYNSHYNLREQGFFADYVIIMTYDEHTGTDIGPNASIGYTEYGIKEALNYVPAERLVDAVPFYTNVWRINDGAISSEALGMAEAHQYVSDNAIPLRWDDESGCYYGETMIGTGQIQIWLEDEKSMELKIGKIREYDIGGVAAWRLGLESPQIWGVMDIS